MGSRNTHQGAEKAYAAAVLWTDRALRADDSLFTPGESIWSSRWIAELRARYLEQPDVSGDGFYTKLERQLEGSQPEVYQLAAEVLYFHFLVVSDATMRHSTKKDRLFRVLGWSGKNIEIPSYLLDALAPGLAATGQAFNTYRPAQVGWLVEFADQWKKTSPQSRDHLLKEPWDFKDSLRFSPTGKLFDEYTEGTYRAQRVALLHLVFPDMFEVILSLEQKKQIADIYSGVIKYESEDLDRQLTQIRQYLEAKYQRDVDFYDDDIRQEWDPQWNKVAWDSFVALARTHWDSGEVDSIENNYKFEIGRKLSETRQAVLANSDNWVESLAKSLPNNPLGWRSRLNFLKWSRRSRADALKALQAIWTQKSSSVGKRISDFSDLFPRSQFSGTGTRMRYISVLLMGLDVRRYPPFQTTRFQQAYNLTGYDHPDRAADEAGLYRHSLGFLDRFIDEASKRGLTMRHRLDAQSLVWMVLNKPTTQPPLEGLAADLLLPVEFLERIDTLLKEKSQVIFQGPPGTGKTYIAQELAACLAGSEERVTLVQFHPSYAYEDFVQGFRPTLTGGGQPGFKLTDGPLLTAAKRARAEPEADHFLVIDEINRGNLAKVLGELYFLLEYRDRKMRLQYQAEDEEDFSLPENLYIIGTMNTADRSIALVDLALRRRFHFLEFHPDHKPIKGLLRRWLKSNAPSMEWVADVVEQANRKLKDDRHVAIGPSYFMVKNGVLNQAAVERIWEHNVLPYLEEHLFGNPDGLDQWQLPALRNKAKKDSKTEDETSEAADASA